MIKALPSETAYAVTSWGTPGEVGTLAITIYDNQGAVSVARDTTVIQEIASGIYLATFTAPATDGQYSVVFDNEVQFLAEDLFVGEDVEDESAVLAGDTIELTADWNDTGLTGTLAVTIYDSAGNVDTTRSTANIIEVADEIYAATRIAPSTPGQYTVVWDDGVEFTAESLVVIPLVRGKTLEDLVDLVQLGRFEDEDRPRIVEAINSRYQQLWAIEEWTFKYAIVDVVLVAGQQALDGPDNLGTAVMLWDDSGQKLDFLAPREFYRLYTPETQGKPCHWTVVGGAVLLGPTPDAALTYKLLYEKDVPELEDEDDDEPEWPSAFRMVLVHAARAEMLAINDDPNAQTMEAQVAMALDAMRRRYLSDAIGEPSYWPSDNGGW